MSTTPSKPQMLPWLAKKAGIGDARASALWLDSTQWAAQHASPDSSVFHELAADRMRELVAAESLRQDLASFGLRPWARAQVQFWTISMQAAQKSAAVMAHSWRSFGSSAQHYKLG